MKERACGFFFVVQRSCILLSTSGTNAYCNAVVYSIPEYSESENRLDRPVTALFCSDGAGY